MSNIYLIPVDFPDDINSKEDADRKFNEILEDIQDFKNRLRELVFCTDFDKICPKDIAVIDWLEQQLKDLIGEYGSILEAQTMLHNLAKLSNNWEQAEGLRDLFDQAEKHEIINEVPVDRAKPDLSLN